VHVLHTVTGVGGSGANSFFDDYLYNAALICAAAVCLLRAATVAAERWA
jgi:hypothetical protein